MDQNAQTAAFYHPLTGLPNALLLTDRLQQALIFAKRYGMWLAILTVELADMAQIEQQYGVKVADDFALIIANRLAETIYQQDSVAQLERGKFIILLTCLFRDAHYSLPLQRLLKVLSTPVELGTQTFTLNFHIGISLAPEHGDSAEALIAHAEIGLAYAKKTGVNNFKMYQSTIDAANIDLHRLQNELAQALQKNEFLLEYQPIYDIKKQTIIAAEALLRWQHPKYGLINPRTFLPLAHTVDLITPLSEWVLRTACEQNRLWQESGLPAIQMVINSFEQHIKIAGFKESLLKILKETRILPAQLELEIAEQHLAMENKVLIQLMLDLQAIGVHITLNDFDRRFSNIDFLMQFPVHKIKINNAQLANISKNTEDADVVRAAIAAAHQLKLRVLAVGVETKEQFEFLKMHQVDEIQGYYFSKPIGARNFAKLLQDNKVLYNE